MLAGSRAGRLPWRGCLRDQNARNGFACGNVDGLNQVAFNAHSWHFRMGRRAASATWRVGPPTGLPQVGP